MRKKKWLAVLLAVIMIVAMLPTSAFALTADGAVETEEELVAAMSAGGTVTLGSDITITQASQQFRISGQSVILDLNGFALTREGENSQDLFYINDGGSLTINDSKGGGSITSSYPVQLMSNSTFILNGGDIVSPKGSVIDIFNGVSNVLVEMNGGSVRGAADNTFGIRGSSNVKVNINGGVISAVPGNRLAMYISGSNDKAIEINFTSGQIVAEDQAIQAYSGAVINVSGDASIHSDNRVAISTQSGSGDSVVELNVTGGSITTDGQTSYAIYAQDESKVNIEGGTVSGGTAVMAYDTSDVQISGGEIEGKREAINVGSGGTPTVNVTGGEFNKNVDEYIAPDAPVAEFTSGNATTYVVGGTIAEKAASASEGDEIEITSGDVDLTDVPDGVSVTNNGDGNVEVNGDTLGTGESVVTHTHVLTHTAAASATCEKDGNSEYWYCESCQKYFSDEACTVETTLEATVIPETGHAYGKQPVWTWSEDNTSATATFTCENDETHTVVEKATVEKTDEKAATCTAAGSATYTATVTFNGEEQTATKTVELPMIAHNYKDGVCTACGAKAPDSGASEKPDNSDNQNVPQTGDDGLFLWALLLCLSGATALMALFVRRARQRG